MLLPLVIAGLGIVASVIGTFLVRVRDGGDPRKALHCGQLVAGGILLIGALILTNAMLPKAWALGETAETHTSMGVFGAVFAGLVAGIAIGHITEFNTGTGKKPVIGIGRQSLTRPATNLLAGLGAGIMSTALPVIVLSTAILCSYHFAGLYGIGIAAVGMLANTGIQLAVDASSDLRQRQRNRRNEPVAPGSPPADRQARRRRQHHRRQRDRIRHRFLLH